MLTLHFCHCIMYNNEIIKKNSDARKSERDTKSLMIHLVNNGEICQKCRNLGGGRFALPSPTPNSGGTRPPPVVYASDLGTLKN